MGRGRHIDNYENLFYFNISKNPKEFPHGKEIL
jgi:hypothetical protein